MGIVVRAIGLTVLFAALCIASGPTSASETGTTEIVVACPPAGWPPFLIVDGDPTTGKGIMLDVIRTVASTCDHTVNLVLYPEKRSRLLLREGLVDAYPKAREWVSDPDQLLWTDPVVDSADILISRNRKVADFSTISDLKRLKIGVIHGFSYPTLEPYFKDGTIKRHTARTTEALLLMVQRGHIDAAVTNRIVGEWIISNSSELRRDELIFSTQTIDSAPYRFAFARYSKWQIFIRKFNAELAAMKQDGRLDAIMARYR